MAGGRMFFVIFYKITLFLHGRVDINYVNIF